MSATEGYTSGDLYPLLYAMETTYGVTPTTGWAYGPQTLTFADKTTINQYNARWGGDRSVNVGAMVASARSVKFSIEWNDTLRTAWMAPLVQAALGSATGTTATDALPSFSLIRNVGGTYYLYNGVKVDQLKLQATSAERVVKLSADCVAQYVAPISVTGTTATVTGLQALTLTLPAFAQNTAAAVLWTGAVDADGTALYPQSWDLTVSNGIGSDGMELGAITGADGQMYYGARTIRAGDRDIILNASVFMKDFTIYQSELENATVDAVTLTVGGQTLTLGTGRYIVDGSSWPSFAQEKIMLPIKMRFQSVAEASA